MEFMATVWLSSSHGSFDFPRFSQLTLHLLRPLDARQLAFGCSPEAGVSEDDILDMSWLVMSEELMPNIDNSS